MLLLQSRVGVEHVGVVTGSALRVVQILRVSSSHQRIVTFFLEVVLNFDLSFVLRLVLDDGEKLLTLASLALLSQHSTECHRCLDSRVLL